MREESEQHRSFGAEVLESKTKNLKSMNNKHLTYVNMFGSDSLNLGVKRHVCPEDVYSTVEQ